METLRSAEVSVAIDGDAAATAARHTSLPYHWSRLHGGNGGSARFDLVFSLPDPKLPSAIYIARIGNRYELAVNGVVLVPMSANAGQDRSKQPQRILIPPGLARPHNRLQIRIAAAPIRNGGLSEIQVGPASQIEAIYGSQYFWRVTASYAVAAASIVLGALALLLWLRQRDKLYLLYGASELLWALYVSDVFFIQTPLPWRWWEGLTFAAQGLAGVMIFKFALIVVDRHKGPIKRATDWNLALVVPAVLIGMLGGLPQVEPMLKFATDVVILCATAVVLRHGLGSNDAERRVMAIAVLLITAVGTRDELVLVILPYTGLIADYASQYGDIAWTRNAWLVFTLALAWIIAERMRKSSLTVAAMNRMIAHRIAQREAELKDRYAQQTESARRNAMLDERQRMMRDMHDGLGSQILSAVHLSQDPRASRAALIVQLHEAFDQLRLAIDAMQDVDGDLAALLGGLRYRLGPRIDGAGVRLDWQVASLPPIAGWTLQHSRELQMLLFECISNLIAHAGASRAVFCAQYDAASDQVRLSLQDNGCGFDPVRHYQGHGLSSMRVRAGRIGGQLTIHSDPSTGTRTELALPVAPCSASVRSY